MTVIAVGKLIHIIFIAPSNKNYRFTADIPSTMDCYYRSGSHHPRRPESRQNPDLRRLKEKQRGLSKENLSSYAYIDSLPFVKQNIDLRALRHVLKVR
jgi:hypothetical protein